MSLSSTDTVEVHTEDVELVEKLAKLQHMHEQITGLRELLPTALFGPAREAIAQPRRANPRTLAMAVSKAAQKGNQEVQAFKKDWHDEKVRQIFKETNAAKAPQGTDVWLLDYQVMSATRKTGPAAIPKQDKVPFDTLESAKAVLDEVRKSDKHIHIESAGDMDPFPLIVQVARLKLQVVRDESEATFRVDAIKTESEIPLIRQIVDQINRSVPYKKLEQLLVLISAYHDVRLRKCDKCNNLVDNDFNLPVVREKSLGSTSNAQSPLWHAYHTGCET